MPTEPVVDVEALLRNRTPMQLVAQLARKQQLDRLSADDMDFLAVYPTVYAAYQATPDIQMCLFLLEECGAPVRDLAFRRYLYGVAYGYRAKAMCYGDIRDTSVPYEVIDGLCASVYRMTAEEGAAERQKLHKLAGERMAALRPVHPDDHVLFGAWQLIALATRSAMAFNLLYCALETAKRVGRSIDQTSADNFRQRYYV